MNIRNFSFRKDGWHATLSNGCIFLGFQIGNCIKGDFIPVFNSDSVCNPNVYTVIYGIQIRQIKIYFMKTNIKHDKLDFLNAFIKVFIIGLVLTLMGGGTLLGMKIYEAFLAAGIWYRKNGSGIIYRWYIHSFSFSDFWMY